MNRRLTILGAPSLVVVLWIVVAIACWPNLKASAMTQAKSDPVLGERIAKGIVFKGRLWLRGTMATHKDPSGALVSVSLENQQRKVYFEQGVLDIEKFNGNLWVLRRVPTKHREFVVSAWRDGAIFDDVAKFELSEKDEPIAFLHAAGFPVVLSKRTVHALGPDTVPWRVTELKGELRSGVQVSAASPEDGESAYVGFNVGEWGWGLQQVDFQTGAVTDIERRDTKQACAGPLNSACDPVTGVIADPQNKHCVLVSTGLVHMFHSEGRILRVCGQDVSLVSKLTMPEPEGKFEQTEAFYGLAPSDDGGFWAITWRALYRFEADGVRKKEYALPKLKPVSGVYLSRELPGAIIVRTDMNWAVSTSGYTPLVVPLEGSLP